MPDGAGGFFSAFMAAKEAGKGGQGGKIPDSEFGGTHFLGTGRYEAKTPEQARQLRSQLPQGSHKEQQRLEEEEEEPHEFEPTSWLAGDPNICRKCGKPRDQHDEEEGEEQDNEDEQFDRARQIQRGG